LGDVTVETISYSDVQDLVLQVPPQRLPVAYELLRELSDPSDPSHSRAELLRLPLAERHAVLARQAEEMKAHYEQNSDERAGWQAGDFMDEYSTR
jgi:hypothetical protein